MDSKLRGLFLAVPVFIILFLLGGFVVNNILGMILVIIAIGILGFSAGRVMDSPCSTAGEE
ncbi:MAG: hypothetical protein PHH47_08515 [Gallionella sp.]|nr:hypothetical protein [Gallionella sp.]MDD4945910.1 hypothetical protein [Gallionella sp.]MDD5611434.1 hypothetical protein [Gallionella sp.]